MLLHLPSDLAPYCLKLDSQPPRFGFLLASSWCRRDIRLASPWHHLDIIWAPDSHLLAITLASQWHHTGLTWYHPWHHLAITCASPWHHTKSKQGQEVVKICRDKHFLFLHVFPVTQLQHSRQKMPALKLDLFQSWFGDSQYYRLRYFFVIH